MQVQLRAFVKFNDENKIVPGMLVTRTRKPAGLGWVEIPATYSKMKALLDAAKANNEEPEEPVEP